MSKYWIQENTDQKNYVLGHFSCSDYFCFYIHYSYYGLRWNKVISRKKFWRTSFFYSAPPALYRATHCVKSVQTWTRKNSVLGNFSRSDYFCFYIRYSCYGLRSHKITPRNLDPKIRTFLNRFLVLTVFESLPNAFRRWEQSHSILL